MAPSPTAAVRQLAARTRDVSAHSAYTLLLTRLTGTPHGAAVYYNSFRGAWAFLLRHNACPSDAAFAQNGLAPSPYARTPGIGMRLMRYVEAKTFAEAHWAKYQHKRMFCGGWREGEPVFNYGPDEVTRTRTRTYPNPILAVTLPELSNPTLTITLTRSIVTAAHAIFTSSMRPPTRA